MNQVELLRHVADNLEAGRLAGYGLLRDNVKCFAEHVADIGFHSSERYSLAPRARIINGVEVPAPMDKVPSYNTQYWSESIGSELFSMDDVWVGSHGDFMRLSRGQCYESEEAAAANCKARYGIK